MKRAEYVSQAEMKDIFILGGVQQGIADLIASTKDKDWLKKLRTCSTLLTKLVDERFAVIPDPKELVKLKRRVDSCLLYWTTKDGVANFAPPDKTDYRVPEDDLFTICECAMMNRCDNCTGNYKECALRNAMQACGIPAMTGNPDGKCEYWVERLKVVGE